MIDYIRKSILLLAKRAEGYDPRYLKETFVDLENLYDSLKNTDHQVIYGRRGTGKTHLLRIVDETVDNNIKVYIDMRTIGSTGGIYNDPNVPLSERSTRFVMDVLGKIHESLYSYAVNDENSDLDLWTSRLDEFAQNITEVIVVGEKEIECKQAVLSEEEESYRTGISLSASALSINGESSSQGRLERSSENTLRKKGSERCRIHFGRLQQVFVKIAEALNGKRLIVLIDEWSEIAFDIQPILADLIKRTLLPIQGITVKIAAIEKRCNFLLVEEKDRIGIEIGGDIPATIDLDEYLVFDNNKEKALSFYRALIARHVRNGILQNGNVYTGSDEALISEIFSRSDGFSEFVKSVEGVPRDAINILTTCCQLTKDDRLTIPDIRLAAKKWYNIGKEAALINKDARKLLRWIIDVVIGERKSRAFLVEADLENELLDTLYDMRLIHIIKRGVSSNDRPGERFIVYAIDYGCYVELINTVKEPMGLFQIEVEEIMKYIEVPENDYRSIRRAILDIERFTALKPSK